MSQSLSNKKDFTEILDIINEMVDESMYHTETLAHTLQIHHNRAASEVFSAVAEQFRKEHQIISEYLQDVQLTNRPPWEEPHEAYEHPSVLLLKAHYQMSEEEAWEIMEKMVTLHQNLYSRFLEESDDKNVLGLMQRLIDHCKQSIN